MARVNFWNLSNVLTLSRIMLSFVLYGLWFVNSRSIFVIVFVLAGLTDALDGFFARKMRISSEFGKWLDSLADRVFFYSLPVWVWLWEPRVFLENKLFVGVVLAGVLVEVLVGLWKHHGMISLHLSSAKIAAVVLFVFGVLTFLGVYHPLLLFFTGFMLLCSLGDGIVRTVRK